MKCFRGTGRSQIFNLGIALHLPSFLPSSRDLSRIVGLKSKSVDSFEKGANHQSRLT